MNFAKVFKSQYNHFHLLRHAAAMAVIVDHAFIINGEGHLLARLGAKTSLGAIGVALFFILSGALVTGSYLNCASPLDFVLRRVRRIYPGYLVCLIVTAFLVYPLVSFADGNLWSTRGWLAPEGPIGYLCSNALVIQYQNRIHELFSTNPEPYSVNGSLWSIAWEIGCYTLVLGLGAFGVLRKQPWIVGLGLVATFLNLCIFPAGSILGRYYLSERVVFLPTLFLSGMAFYLYRDQISCSRAVGGYSQHCFS